MKRNFVIRVFLFALVGCGDWKANPPNAKCFADCASSPVFGDCAYICMQKYEDEKEDSEQTTTTPD